MTVYDPTKKLPKKALREFTLAKGYHPDRSNGLCVMELAAWLAGRQHTDRPECVSPVIGEFLRSWNDSLNDTDRQMLKPYAAKVLNTATTEADEQARAWLATDWLVREYAPAWLRLAGLTKQAESLEQLAALTNRERAIDAKPTLSSVSKDAAAAGAAAWDAAWAAAGVAARDAARDAAWDAAGVAAWDAAWAAAGVAARAAAGAAAWDAARDAAGAAAGVAARVAARDALIPTTKALQKSTLLLLDRMIDVGA